jgi:3-(3-hydroxy-phenyl)propionate hydroxylase
MGTLDIQDASKNWSLRGGTLQEDGIGGTLGVQAHVGTGARTALLDEIVPPGFLLPGRDRDPAELLSPVQRAVWRQLGGRSAHFGPGGFTDTDGKYAAWFERLNASVVLVRPDFQVFGGVRTPYATDGLVHHLIQRVLA